MTAAGDIFMDGSGNYAAEPASEDDAYLGAWHVQLDGLETYEDAVNDIVEKHKEFIQTQYSIDDDSYVYILEYDTEGLDNHLTDIEFMNNITEQNGLGSMFP